MEDNISSLLVHKTGTLLEKSLFGDVNKYQNPWFSLTRILAKVSFILFQFFACHILFFVTNIQYPHGKKTTAMQE